MTSPGVLDPVAIRISRPLVLTRLGYTRPEQVPPKSAALIDEVIDKAKALLAPRAIWGVFPVSSPEPDAIAIAGTLRAASRSLRERLSGCRVAALFAATIGPEAERWQGGLLRAGETARGLLADACLSSAAIALGLEVEGIVSRWLREEGLTATRRHAPGYGDWELKDQAPLLRLIEAGRIGITLTEEFLMLPAKSISGVIGGR